MRAFLEGMDLYTRNVLGQAIQELWSQGTIAVCPQHQRGDLQWPLNDVIPVQKILVSGHIMAGKAIIQCSSSPPA